jgi:hypothetical protein
MRLCSDHSGCLSVPSASPAESSPRQPFPRCCHWEVRITENRTPRCHCHSFLHYVPAWYWREYILRYTPVPPRRLPDSSGTLLLVGSLLVGKRSGWAGSANIGPLNATLTAWCSGATLRTPSKQSTLPRGAAGQRYIPQVNNQHCRAVQRPQLDNQHYRVVQRCNAVYAFVSLLLVLLAPRNFCLSLACPSRSMEMLPLLLSHSLSLVRVCIHFSLSLSFVFVTAGGAALYWEICSLIIESYFKSCRVFPLWEKSDPDRRQV